MLPSTFGKSLSTGKISNKNLNRKFDFILRQTFITLISYLFDFDDES